MFILISFSLALPIQFIIWWVVIGTVLWYCELHTATIVFNIFQIFTLLAFHSYAIKKTRIMKDTALKSARQDEDGGALHAQEQGQPRQDTSTSTSYNRYDSRAEHDDFVANARRSHTKS